jgi:hypothetical protein
MGKTAFSGPAFGAQQTLLSVGPVAASTGSSAAFFGAVVPAGEDWYATELSVYRNSTGSTNLVISLLDDSSLVGSVTGGGSSIAMAGITVLTTDPGEFSGTKLLSGSTLTLVHSSHAGPNANLCVVLSGYRRFTLSTRSGQ